MTRAFHITSDGMPCFRFKGKEEDIMSEYFNVADIFGEDVFSDKVMQERLPKKVYKALKKTI